VRGTETNLIKRLKISKQRISKPLFIFGSVIMTLFILLGSFIFYHTNVLNKHWTNSETTAFRVGYEKALKKFEYIPQPKIVSVNLNVELYPSSRDYSAEGYYILKNTKEATINEVHIQKIIEDNVVINDVAFESGATINNEYSKYYYTIHKLKTPLKPGDSIKMSFKQTYTTKGFLASGSNTAIVENGTFFNNENFPTLGYTKKYELQDTKKRIEFQLPKRVNKASREDVNELQNAQSGGDSDGINFEMIIGTEIDQTAIVPGDLIKQWTENNRSYYHYKMKQPIINFYAMVSARYELKKDTWLSQSDAVSKQVDLEIYYHKGHDYNIDRMMKSMKVSLDYYSTHFSPYQYEQLRIMEFPRYAEFAQSFPGTVPFSEAIGFVLDIDDETDVDMAFYVTAHEIAHQWFAMQVEAANVKGQYFILETLSQYAAIMVLKEHYPKEKVQQFLELQLEKYEEGKRRESGVEPTLALVENQDYIYYAKGAINMYKLQEIIGEDKVNLTLKQFLEDWNTIDGKLKIKTGKYAASKDLLGCFREITPDNQQYIITELFESVAELKIN
jgi:hypothetical protein